jgi:hypothetical protein
MTLWDVFFPPDQAETIDEWQVVEEVDVYPPIVSARRKHLELQQKATERNNLGRGIPTEYIVVGVKNDELPSSDTASV